MYYRVILFIMIVYTMYLCRYTFYIVILTPAVWYTFLVYYITIYYTYLKRSNKLYDTIALNTIIRGDPFNISHSLFQKTITFLKIFLLHNFMSLHNNTFFWVFTLLDIHFLFQIPNQKIIWSISICKNKISD